MSPHVQPGQQTGRQSMLTALREGTRREHLTLERELDLPRRMSSRHELARVLAAMLASWEPLELHLAGACDWSTVRIDPHLGEASYLLRADLAALGHRPGPTSPVPPPVRFDTPAQAVGGRYVLLGSAMGGRVIAIAIERWLGINASQATRFFRREGMDPVRDWRAFRAAVDARAWSPDEQRQAVTAARDTFEYVGAVARPLLHAA